MDIIYYLCGDELYSNKLNKYGCKIGSTKYIVPRMQTYQTGYTDKVPLKCYFKINSNCYEFDNLIQKKFNKYRLNIMGSEGGTEIYDVEKLTIDKLESFLIEHNTQPIKYLPTDVDFELYKQKINKRDKLKLIDEEEIIDNINKIQTTEELNDTVIYNKLYTWQKEAFNECKLFFESDDKTGIIIAPTGSGKSYFMNFISIYHYIRNTQNDVIIMTKRKEILDNDFIIQGYDFIRKLNLDCEIINLINNKNNNYQIFENTSSSNNIYIINIDKFTSSTKFSSYEKYTFGKIKLLLFDECHWCGAPNIFKFIDYMKNNIVDKIIGFSATPIRQYDINKNNSFEIFKNLDNEYNIIYIRGYLDSINDGDRVKTNWVIIKTNSENLKETTLDILDDEKEIIKCRYLNKKGFKDYTNELNKFLQANQSICGKGILWFPNIKNLMDYYNFIEREKYKYDKLSNTTFFPTFSSNKEYEDTSTNLEKFKELTYDAILLAVFRATEGYDDKPIDFGFNVYIVKKSNPLLDQQKEGRVSRNYPGKQCGYFGFLTYEDTDDEIDNISKRLANWIEYMKEFEGFNSKSKTKKPQIEKTFQDYLNIIIDCKNFDNIEEFDKIKKRIFKYVEKIENDVTSASTVKRIIQKENKKRLANLINKDNEIIDTKEKYDLYATEWGMSLSNSIKNVEYNNFVKLLRPDFNEFIKLFYTWEQLNKYFRDNKIKSIDECKQINNTNIPSYSLILSGIYNENKNEKALVNIFYKEKQMLKF